MRIKVFDKSGQHEYLAKNFNPHVASISEIDPGPHYLKARATYTGPTMLILLDRYWTQLD